MPSKHLHTAGLAELLDCLQKEYYAPIGAAHAQSIDGGSAEVMDTVVREYLSLRLDRLVPYLTELSRKSTDGHNCGTCQGKCHLEHGSYISELMHSHDLIRKSATADASEADPGRLKALLAESIIVESTYLIPAISKAQKTINVQG